MIKLKILMPVIIFCFISSSAMANFYIDFLGGLSLNIDNSEYPGFEQDNVKMYGVGIGVGYNIFNYLSILGQAYYSAGKPVASVDGVGIINFEHKHMAALLGVEYLLPFLIDYRVLIRVSALAGYGTTKVISKPPPPYEDDEFDDSGFPVAFYAGIMFIATQHFMPFIDVGYYKIFGQDDMNNNNESFNLQFIIGIRYSISRFKPLERK